MAKQMMKLTVEEVRANIPYDLICMVRYGCTWSSGRRRRAWLADFSESEREAAGRLFRMAHNWTVGRGVPDTVQMSRKTFHREKSARWHTCQDTGPRPSHGRTSSRCHLPVQKP